jgi:hypothetical protein
MPDTTRQARQLKKAQRLGNPAGGKSTGEAWVTWGVGEPGAIADRGLHNSDQNSSGVPRSRLGRRVKEVGTKRSADTHGRIIELRTASTVAWVAQNLGLAVCFGG